MRRPTGAASARLSATTNGRGGSPGTGASPRTRPWCPVAHDPDPAAKESLAALLGGLITDAKDLLVRELRLTQLEVGQSRCVPPRGLRLR